MSPESDPTAGTGGTYSLDRSIIDRDLLHDVIDDNPVKYGTLPHKSTYGDIDPDLVMDYAAATGDDQDIHVGDVDGRNVVHGALTLSWMLDTLDRQDRQVKEIDYARFTTPVHYDRDDIDNTDRVRMFEQEYGRDHGGQKGVYVLERKTPDGDIDAAVELGVWHGRPGANAMDPEIPVDERDFIEYLSYTIGSFFDRTGDVIIGVDEMNVYTPVDERRFPEVDGPVEQMERRHEQDIEEGGLHDALGSLGDLRRYRNYIGPEGDGTVDAKLYTTVLETFDDDSLHALMSD